MLKQISLFVLLLMFGFLSGCAVIGDIFKAGVWVGVLVVVGIIALVLYLITRGSNKS
jgi:hypothetical protein